MIRETIIPIAWLIVALTIPALATVLPTVTR